MGDILESVNGQSMANADHREAVRAVKESKETIAVVCFKPVVALLIANLHHLESIYMLFLQSVRRRRHAHPLVVGIVSAVNSVPHMDPATALKPEEHNFSLLVNSKDST